MKENNLENLIFKKYESFLKNYKDEDFSKLLKEKDNFIQKYNLKKIKSMKLDEYCIGNRKDNSFSYILERSDFIGDKLGSIRGGNANKFGIYYNSESGEYKFNGDFKDQDIAFASVIDNIEKIISSKNLSEIKDSIFWPSVKRKIFYLYHSEEIIPFYGLDKIKDVYLRLGFDKSLLSNNAHDNYIIIQEKFLSLYKNLKLDGKTTISFMYFLYDYVYEKYKLSNIINEIRKDQVISEEQLYNILISLTVTNFLIFSGPSGTGKTSIVEKISNNLNGKFHKFSVKSNFSDESSILGYWNPLLAKYEGTEILKFLINSSKANNDKIYFLLLDEMNLSKVENYFSTFLSEIDKFKISLNQKEKENEDIEGGIILFETNISNKKQYENIKYFLESYFDNDFEENIWVKDDLRNIYIKTKEDFKKYGENEAYKNIKSIRVSLKLKSNLKIIGTINEDETTNSISNKVLDRGQFINFEVGDLFGENNNASVKQIDKNLLKNKFFDEFYYNIISQKEIEEYFGNLKEYEDIKKLINSINIEIQKISINESVGYRVIEEIMTYIKNYCDYDGEKKSVIGLTECLDNQISQKVLTKLKTFSLVSEDSRKAFDEIGEILEKLEYKIIKNGKEKNEQIKLKGRLDKSIKFYNHLKNNLL